MRLPQAFGQSSIQALEVASAGTKAYDDDPMDVSAGRESARLGVPDADAHRARRIREPHVSQADLILGMAREHRAASAGLVPSANRRVFTLVEFVLIVEYIAAGTIAIPVRSLGEDGFTLFMRGVVEAAGTARGLMPQPAVPESLDIEDPYRLAPEVYHRSADAVALYVDRLSNALRALASADRRARTRPCEKMTEA